MDESAALALAEPALGVTGATEIARGGQKIVYRALLQGVPVILKIAHISNLLDPNALERCQREVALLKDLHSPNVVKVLSDLAFIGTGPDAAAWLEEELDGQDLHALLGRPWTWSDVADLLAQVGSGLSAMHASGYVHRDLSPGNVRRTTQGYKVMDPGLAKHLNRTSITGLWQPGTPGFLSPEHATLGGRITPASDVYCLGILAFLALTGEFPIDPSGDPNQYRQRLLAARPPAVRSRRPDLSEPQASIVDRCLDRQPARRFLDADEVLDAVRVLASGGGN